jgi:2-keto-3-deoxy-L-rhamnonate aldolase RhmA
MNDLKARIAARERVVGTWVKTPHPIIAEVLGLTDLDCMVLDAEHAPFDRAALDACVMASRLGSCAAIVRPPSGAPEHVLQALDSGAAGVIVPHVRSAAEAEALVRATRYEPGGRGYAGTTRAAGYTKKGMAKTRADAARAVVIAQVEDIKAVEAIDEIVRVPGIDAVFIGRADLTVAYRAETPDDPRVVAAVDRICAAGAAADRAVGMFLPRPEDAPAWAKKGASLFLLASEHDFILKGANELAKMARG